MTAALDDASSRAAPRRVTARTAGGEIRPASPAEAAGRPIVVRAAAAGIAGGALIAVVAGSFGPRFFTADVRAWGIAMGLVAVLLLLAPLTGTRVLPGTGQVLILVGILAIPVAAGGFGLGSLLVITAGVLLAATAPAGDGAVVVTAPARALRRVLALAVDLGLTVVATVLVVTAPWYPFPLGSDAVLGVWLGVWLVVTVPSTALAVTTPGRWLVSVRVRATRDGWWRPVVREAARGLVALACLLGTAAAWLTAGPAAGAAALAASVLAALAGTLPTRTWLDRVTATVPVASRVTAV
jgi:hypothetical protein